MRRFQSLLLAVAVLTSPLLTLQASPAHAAWNSVPCRWVYDSSEGGNVWSCYADGWRFMPESDNDALNGLTVTVPETGYYMYAVVVSPDWSVYEYVGGPEGRADQGWGLASYTLPDDATGWQVGLIDYGPVGWDGTSSYLPPTPTTSKFPWVLEARVDNPTIAVAVDPTFAFTTSAGSFCNGVSATGTSTATAVDLGRPITGVAASAVQNLTLATNAANGGVIRLRGGPLTGSRTITSVTGTNESPGAFGSGERFGYTVDDGTLSGPGTVNRFTNNGPHWAALSAANEHVMHTGDTSTVTNCIAYRFTAEASTPAGVYTTTVTYTAVPNF